ncbi:hypothetical protein CP533_0175 [Ophiocordyceps camponoti-saundersi (nom. inval.)]|nr:hypothetical protein CP533_0175 [Ophiocordyceps camponoti-saundersi (nom. inval.)]
MPPQIKKDLNRSGWETTDFPSVCENCLPENPFVKMIKEDYGAQCKLCTRPFTVFAWSTDRAQGRKKTTNICLTCARLKNCCQGCMLDLSFGLPIAVRDAALKLVAPGPQSDINREYFAQNNEKLIEEGKVGTEEYEKTDEKARELLRRLATSKPYFRKGRAVDETEARASDASGGSTGVGPIRTRDSRAAARGKAGKGRLAVHSAAPTAPTPRDWLPPDDKNIMSLFVTGIEDDLPEYKLRDFFKAHGRIKSLVCSHMSHCAFINYETREAAEQAAAACQGRAVIAGCPLRVRWGQPRAIGTMDKEERGNMLRDARVHRARGRDQQWAAIEGDAAQEGPEGSDAVPAPPGAGGGPKYSSLSGE